MSEEMYPGWYSFIKEKHEKFIQALEHGRGGAPGGASG
jgi:hypothetical protein